MVICSFHLSHAVFRLKTSNKWTNNAQQNNDYRFVDVISGKLTLLMSINLRHGILLSALFVCFFVLSLLLLLPMMRKMFSFLLLLSFHLFLDLVCVSTPVKFSSGKTKGIMSVWNIVRSDIWKIGLLCVFVTT